MAGKKNKNKKNAEASGGEASSGNQQQQQVSQPSSNQARPSQPNPQAAQQGNQANFQWGQQAVPQPAQQQQQSSWGPPKNQEAQQQPSWGPPKNQEAQQPKQQESRPQTQSQQGTARPNAQGGSKNKYPKKAVEQPLPPVAAPASSCSDSDVGDIAEKMFQTKMSPAKTIGMIESSPDGRVYEGTRGKVCNLEVNYLQISVGKLIPKAFHYDVSFNPDIPKKLLPKALDKLMEIYFPKVYFAFDGRASFYTNQLLAVKGVVFDGAFEQEVEAVLGDRKKNFKVKVKFAADVDLSVLRNYRDKMYQINDKPMRAIQCLDVILRTVFKQMTFNNRAVAAGRALYFANEGRPLDLGEGMELWLGLFQSAVLGRKSLYLNVDVAHKAFPSEISLLQLLATMNRGEIPQRLDGRSEYLKTKLTEYLKMLSIGYRLSNKEAFKTFGFNQLVASPRDAVFVDDKNVKMTVLEYFQRVKKITLKYPDLPCLHVGSKIRNIYLPLELCVIPAGQATNKKCTPNAVAAMIKYSATSTEERKKKIRDLLNKIDYGKDGSEVKGFGIEVDKNFQRVGGRVIDPPQIKYITGNEKPRNGVWNGNKFLETQSAPIKWGIVNCDDRTTLQAVKDLSRNIITQSHKQGMTLTDFKSEDYVQHNFYRQNRLDDIVKVLDNYFKNNYKLVFVIIVDMNDCYAKVKQAAELKVGIMTQCIKANTIFRMGKGNPMMTIGNIMLKVNAKLNGKNHEVIESSYQGFNSANSGVMFVGGDVTHPSPDQRDIPSVVGVAASYDSVGFRYQCAWRLQDPKKEMIVDLENILVEQLKFYLGKNGKLPGKIMYYRDGVSDGQFGEVLQVEMTAIRGAMKRMYGMKPPALVTFVIVQKRHHTRFFPTERQFMDGKNQNIMPGTVVDKDIVHPFQYQFFLASHAAIQGVTKPSKYCVLVNESKIKPDDLQAITYDLCHLFTRCNRSVSYPAPTYYAHLVAARGKSYSLGARLNMQNLQHEFNIRAIQPNFIKNTPMFFV